MAFEGKTKQIREKVFLKGIGEVELVAVNPTKEELNSMLNIESDKEISYISEKDGKKSTRIDFWVKPVGYESLNKITFFLSHDVAISTTGKKEFINNKLDQTWEETIEKLIEKLDSNPDMSWFSRKDLRAAYRGELKLYRFLTTLFNMDLNEGIEQFDNFAAIAQGDLSELRAVLTAGQNNNEGKSLSLKVLFGINESGYQEIYTGHFANARQNKFGVLVRKATEGYDKFNAEWDNDTTLRVVTPSEKPKENETVNKEASAIY